MSRTIGILGLARSGRAAALLALSRGEKVFASDAGDGPETRAAANAIRAAGGTAETGGHTLDELAACDLLVVSPGIPPTASVLRDPRIARLPRVSELDYAFHHLAAPVVAITGTNGKSTTTAWTAHLLQASGFDAPAAGNIGIALSDIAMREKHPDVVVVEASSFQLADIHRFEPRVGVVTNLAPDHLDRYPSVEAYYADKARLFANATDASVWVLNGEDAEVERLAGDAPGTRLYFHVATPLPAGRPGAFVDGSGMLVLRLDQGDVPLVPAAELGLLGEHNRANALAAALAAFSVGATLDGIREGLRSFRALEHRLQPVGVVDGVLWINDSKATNIESTRVALRSMDRPTVLLLGGRHKGEPYTSLVPDMGRVKMVVAYGEAGQQVEADLGHVLPVRRVLGGFEEVVARAAELADPGDAVLLSPACSSYDMFDNYEQRGRRFVELAVARKEAVRG